MRSHKSEGLFAVLIVLCVNVQNPDLEKTSILKIERTICKFLQTPFHNPNRGSGVGRIIFLQPFNISTIEVEESLFTKSREIRDHFPNNRECFAQIHYN